MPILEQTLIATGGDVVVTFVSNDAGYTSELYLDGALGDEIGAIFNNRTTELGSSLNLGAFAEGTELVFTLLVQQTGDVFYTGLADRNADGVVHAVIEQVGGRALVGFEDLFGGGDLDYDDLVFAFTNVLSQDSRAGAVVETTGSAGMPGSGGTPGGGEMPGAGQDRSNSSSSAARAVDEPSALLMLGGGLAMLGLALRRQAARR